LRYFINIFNRCTSSVNSPPRIREGDQGANKKGIKAFSPRRRKERKGRQEIQASMLLLSVLSVFAVKILGFGGFCKQGKKPGGGGGGNLDK
ncbi:MAG: hypothetical protein ACOYNM_04075, partial [Gemmataceae bacterium]